MDEIPVAQEVLQTLSIRQRVCTADALHTQTEFMRVIHELQDETVLTVKGNQPTLYADLATYFADPQSRYLQAETIDRRRGRIKVCTIKVSTERRPALIHRPWQISSMILCRLTFLCYTERMANCRKEVHIWTHLGILTLLRQFQRSS